jgi:hypothetical protein
MNSQSGTARGCTGITRLHRRLGGVRSVVNVTVPGTSRSTHNRSSASVVIASKEGSVRRTLRGSGAVSPVAPFPRGTLLLRRDFKATAPARIRRGADDDIDVTPK